MNRRTFTRILAGALLVTPLIANGQQNGKIPRVGMLLPGSVGAAAPNANFLAFEDGLRNRGWIEGQNIFFERRYAAGRSERYPELAAELVRLKVDVIAALGGPASLKAASEATKTIPIVMVASSRDPVSTGIIKSFSHPGGNITGLTTAPADLAGKQLELLKEAVPLLSRVGVLWDATASPYTVAKELAAAARSLGVQLLAFEVHDPTEIERVIANAAKAQVNGLIMVGSPMLLAQRSQVADLLTKHQLPAIGLWRSQAEAGVLMSYGPSIANEFRIAATYVDRILKGANPGDLPVEQPTKYEFVINMKAARRLGVKIPQSLLLRAEEVIQ